MKAVLRQQVSNEVGKTMNLLYPILLVCLPNVKDSFSNLVLHIKTLGEEATKLRDIFLVGKAGQCY